MKLVVAEKPSVARDLARVLGVPSRGKGALSGKDWVITWCLGHLVELEEPHAYDAAWKRWSFATLPMLPERFRLRPVKRSLDQWRVVRDLLRRRDFEAVVNACDAGREGELIFRYVHERAKSKLPVERLWISSLTPRAIRAGFEALRPGAAYDGLAQAARCRSEADWLVGLNATRAMTLTSPPGSVYSIGRVQTPTLSLIVDREKAIGGFEARPYWELVARMKGPPGDEDAGWTAKWRAPDGATRLGAEALGDELLSRLRAAAGTDAAQTPLRVADVGTRETRESPPQLFDLTSLQRLANRRFGFSAERTLKALQRLYEKHKAVTYPRTSSRYLASDQRAGLPALVDRFAAHETYRAHAQRLREAGLRITKRVVDDRKVTDHHAIIPTGKQPTLAGDEAKLFDVVVRRFLAAFHTDARHAVTEVVLAADEAPAARKPQRVTDAILDALPPPPDQLVARGRVLVDPGWQRVEPPAARGGQTMPSLRLGSVVHGCLATSRSETKPPPRLTDASLLGAMETAGKLVDDDALREAMKDCGLGTPATRAATIETLIRRDYVKRDGKKLVPTAKGIELIDELPVPTLRSAGLTGAWEARLQAIAAGKEGADRFMADVQRLVTETVATLRARRASPPVRRVVGRCPRCRGDVLMERAAFICEACHFAVPRRMAGRGVSEEEVEQLLARGRTKLLSGFRSKTKRRFRAALALEEGEVVFSFPGSPRATGEKRAARPRALADRARLAALVCPCCGGTGFVAGRRAWGCAAWRAGCQLVVPFVVDEKKLTLGELSDLVTKGKTRKAAFGSGKGRLFRVGVRIELRRDEG